MQPRRCVPQLLINVLFFMKNPTLISIITQHAHKMLSQTMGRFKVFTYVMHDNRILRARLDEL